MNKSNVLRSADYLENEVTDEEFDMTDYWTSDYDLHPCRSAGCIAGHIVHGLMGYRGPPKNDTYARVAGRFLGLKYEVAIDLFGSITPADRLEGVTRMDAVRELRRVAETGEVRDRWWRE